MLWVPAERLLVVHAAVFVFPAPLRATALQPVMVLPLSVKVTLPVGLLLLLTVAVKVTLEPTGAGLAELTSEIVGMHDRTVLSTFRRPPVMV